MTVVQPSRLSSRTLTASFDQSQIFLRRLLSNYKYDDTLLMFEGYAAGPHYRQGGSGSNHLCLHEYPQWGSYWDGYQHRSGAIYGVEYEFPQMNVFSKSNNGGNSLRNNPAPCAVCYVGGRSTILMVPARTQCPDGWTREYGGYLASQSINFTRSNYICLDGAPEVAVGGYNGEQGVFYSVEVHCGGLPCSVYNTGRELTCVVCSK